MIPTKWLDDDEQRTWRLFVQMQARLSARLSRELQLTADISLADYDVLVNLGEAERYRLRHFELGEVLQWEQSRLSHHLARMQRRGLVAREECPDDGRGSFVALTPAGHDRLVEAAPAHVAAVRRLVFDSLDPESMRVLERISAGVVRRLAG